MGKSCNAKAGNANSAGQRSHYPHVILSRLIELKVLNLWLNSFVD